MSNRLSLRQLFVILVLAFSILLCISFAFAWVGPTQPPPNGNVAAPVNVGTVDQVKNGGLGVNSLAVFGDTVFSGASVTYTNYGSTSGVDGMGIRNNKGVMEYKNSGGVWTPYATCAASGGGTGNASCTWNGQTIPSGSSVTAYQASTVPTDSQCVSETRTCTNGTLSGTNQYATCTVAGGGGGTTGGSCTYNGETYASGSIVCGCFNSSNAVSGIAIACTQGNIATKLCQNGQWVPSNTSACPVYGKPVIYLYPTTTEEVTVQLKFEGELTASDPTYNTTLQGWQVVARPDGTLVNIADGKEYNYLFWAGTYPLKIDETKGFVVKGSDTQEFLQMTLAEMGLTPNEYDEFIAYWLPKMENNPYNFIQFVGNEYTQSAPLVISPKPDSMLRVFMAFRPLDHYEQVTPQPIQPFERKGFTVVEWGGTELSE